MKQEEFHQSRFRICPKDLLQAVDTEGPPVLQPWGWKTSMLVANSLVYLRTISRFREIVNTPTYNMPATVRLITD
jgi:hypothetical protein